jgi:hypothetical protein
MSGLSGVDRVAQTQWEAAQRGQLVIWTIYHKPRDHPDGFVARRFEVAGEEPKATDDVIAGDLEELRQIFWKAGLVKMPRHPQDEPQIVESWV